MHLKQKLIDILKVYHCFSIFYLFISKKVLNINKYYFLSKNFTYIRKLLLKLSIYSVYVIILKTVYS